MSKLQTVTLRLGHHGLTAWVGDTLLGKVDVIGDRISVELNHRQCVVIVDEGVEPQGEEA